jgi:hypothetical protein
VVFDARGYPHDPSSRDVDQRVHVYEMSACLAGAIVVVFDARAPSRGARSCDVDPCALAVEVSACLVGARVLDTRACACIEQTCSHFIGARAEAIGASIEEFRRRKR